MTRPDPSHAEDRLPVSRRRHGDLGPAAVQRLRLGMATFQAILLSPDLPQWALKIIVPAVAALLALAAALAAALRRAFGVAFLGRPRRRRGGRQRGRPFLACRDVRTAGLCLLPASFPVWSSTRSPRRSRRWSARTCRCRPPRSGCRSCRSPRAAAPTTASSCSLSSATATLAAVEIIHRFASRAVRRGPAWDCGYPDPRPRHPVHGRQLRPADPPRVRRGCFWRASASTCRRPASAAGAADRRAARPRLGLALRADRGASGSRPKSSTLSS